MDGWPKKKSPGFPLPVGVPEENEGKLELEVPSDGEVGVVCGLQSQTITIGNMIGGTRNGNGSMNWNGTGNGSGNGNGSRGSCR